MADEVELEVCCNGLKEAIEGGGIDVVETPEGGIAEGIPYDDGETVVMINFCPFRGAQRPANQTAVIVQ